MRKVQLYLTEEQYRLLKRRAGEDGAIAAVVRALIDDSARPTDPTADEFYRHVVRDKPGSGRRYKAERAKRDLYRRQR